MNNIVLGALLFFVCSTGIFGYVSVQLSEQKGMAVQALHEAQERLADSEKSLNLQIKSCEISDSVTSEYQAEKQVQQDKVQTTISKIDSLPSISLPKKPTQAPSNEINDINIDSKLPDSVISLLRESCVQGEGNVCTNAK